MILIQKKSLSEENPCIYLPNKKNKYAYFYASDLDGKELDFYLERGWRRFGERYYQHRCYYCKKCIPLRVIVEEFKPTKSQKWVLRKAEKIRVKFTALTYDEIIYNIYKDHSFKRFGYSWGKEQFVNNLYTPSCPGFQSEYYLEEKLIGIGIIDHSQKALNSVYFLYDIAFRDYRLGTVSAIKEIEYATSLGLKYYYLGEYIKKNSMMAYKAHFHPHEKYNWYDKKWHPER